jgi:hypothetical protein
MSLGDKPPEIKWVVLFRKDTISDWQIYRHHVNGTPFRFKNLDTAGPEVRKRRRQGQLANAVREDRVNIYGVKLCP